MMILSKFTFICTPDKHWFLKITTIEELLEYWKVFNNTVQEALDTINQTKEFGKGMYHATYLQSVIGVRARAEKQSYKEAFEDITFDTRKSQYQALLEHSAIYINHNMGWSIDDNRQTEQFIHKSEFQFPRMKNEFLKIEKFPLGQHYYVFIDGVQLRKDANLKFDTYDEAAAFAQNYLK